MKPEFITPGHPAENFSPIRNNHLTELIRDDFPTLAEADIPPELNLINPLADPETKTNDLMEILNGKSDWTKAHSQRMAVIFENTKGNLKYQNAPLTDADGQIVSRALLLHDIGKIAIPDPIINSKGPLNRSAWDIMNLHPRISQLILNILHLPEEAELAVSHHQYQKYPVGRKKDVFRLPFTDRRTHNPKREFLQRLITFMDEIDTLVNYDDRPYTNGNTEVLNQAARKGTLPKQVRKMIYANQFLSRDDEVRTEIMDPLTDIAISAALIAGRKIRATQIRSL